MSGGSVAFPIPIQSRGWLGLALGLFHWDPSKDCVRIWISYVDHDHTYSDQTTHNYHCHNWSKPWVLEDVIISLNPWQLSCLPKPQLSKPKLIQTMSFGRCNKFPQTLPACNCQPLRLQLKDYVLAWYLNKSQLINCSILICSVGNLFYKVIVLLH